MIRRSGPPGALIALALLGCTAPDPLPSTGQTTTATAAATAETPASSASSAPTPEPAPPPPDASADAAPTSTAAVAAPPDEPDYPIESLVRCCYSLGRSSGDLVKRKYHGHARNACRGYVERARRGEIEPIEGIRWLQTFFVMHGPTPECVPPAKDAGAPDAR